MYSISGKDARFPALFKTVLKNGYALPHPNCRHEFIPYFEELEDPADVEKEIKNSKIKYDAKGKLVDVRFQKDIEAYQMWQVGNRQLNRELIEFKRMQKHYEGREEEMPYKTLGGLRRARRADNLSPAYKAWRYRKMDENTFERWKGVDNFRNCPKTLENLQEIKYNKSSQWEQLKRERKTISDINSKQWTDSFRDKAINTYYEFRKYGIELTDHGTARIVQRGFTVEEICGVSQNAFNYIQQDGKYIKYYNNIAMVYSSNQKEVVSVLRRPRPSKEWYEN